MYCGTIAAIMLVTPYADNRLLHNAIILHGQTREISSHYLNRNNRSFKSLDVWLKQNIFDPAAAFSTESVHSEIAMTPNSRFLLVLI